MQIRRDYRKVVEERGLPSAPMAMPEQALKVAGSRSLFLMPLFQLFAWKKL
ncbi:hypothetical protein L598_000200002260 [Mesorhizobium sp. J18]|uniref:hypothetical protein n=1 Tax=Mesorhizobium sp. J18 TaxID=935263 RepID=UPI00119B6DE6|nr:hypothetical protein [Mesorhizobium sp. J18]TWG98087.1 hypothetical protein L598_000200002260 [Mesorhizobium sp. J18]